MAFGNLIEAVELRDSPSHGGRALMRATRIEAKLDLLISRVDAASENLAETARLLNEAARALKDWR